METVCSSVTAWCEGSSIMSVRIEEKDRTVVGYGKTIDFLIKIPTTLRQILNYFFCGAATQYGSWPPHS
jgi:hypothetical protein